MITEKFAFKRTMIIERVLPVLLLFHYGRLDAQDKFLKWISPPLNKDVWAVAWSPDSRTIASGGFDFPVRLWNVETGSLMGNLYGHSTFNVSAVNYSPDGKKLASGSWREIIIWDITSLSLVLKWQAHQGWINAISWSPDGEFIAVASWMEAGIWNARTGERVNSLLGHYRDVKSVSWSFDGSKLLTSAEDNSIKMWDARTGQLLGSTMLPPETYLVFSVAWSPLADLFATGSYRTVILWKSDSMRVQNKFADFTDYVRSVVWAPNGKQIAVSGNHPEIRIFDVQTLLQIGSFVYSENQYQTTHYAVAWSPDGKYIVSGSGNDIVGRVIVWDVGNFLTSLKAESAAPPQYFSLLQNYPNPFNASTSFEVRIPKPAFILLKIFDVHGREIETLIAEEKAPGIYTFTWNASSFDSGVYFCRLTTKGFSETKKLLFLR